MKWYEMLFSSFCSHDFFTVMFELPCFVLVFLASTTRGVRINAAPLDRACFCFKFILTVEAGHDWDLNPGSRAVTSPALHHWAIPLRLTGDICHWNHRSFHRHICTVLVLRPELLPKPRCIVNSHVTWLWLSMRFYELLLLRSAHHLPDAEERGHLAICFMSSWSYCHLNTARF